MRQRLLALALVAACAGGVATQAAAAERFVGMDERFAALTAEVPGFGGLYIDEEGRLNVFLQDLGQAPQFQAMDPDARFHRARFDFGQLQDWRMAARPVVLNREGVVFLDIDETRNRLRIGVDRAAPAATIRGLARTLREAGVPRQAVIFERTDPIYFLETLRDKVRPVPGAMQLRFSQFLCTLGFNALREGLSGFVTNSHCTDQQGRVNQRRPTLYYQPLEQVEDQFIGTERVDPAYFRNQSGCPRGARCRFSDSAWAEYDFAGLSAGDEIARTTGVNDGSIDIDLDNPRFDITVKDDSGNQTVGTTVNKIGRTTGWTQGPVSGSCIDTGVAGSNFFLLCQDFVDAGVGGGDSGSNVFRQTGGDDVTLVGILWGGNSEGTLFVYSPYSAVKSELGLD